MMPGPEPTEEICNKCFSVLLAISRTSIDTHHDAASTAVVMDIVITDVQEMPPLLVRDIVVVGSAFATRGKRLQDFNTPPALSPGFRLGLAPILYDEGSLSTARHPYALIRASVLSSLFCCSGERGRVVSRGQQVRVFYSA
jgi:hypothetical protein